MRDSNRAATPSEGVHGRPQLAHSGTFETLPTCAASTGPSQNAPSTKHATHYVQTCRGWNTNCVEFDELSVTNAITTLLSMAAAFECQAHWIYIATPGIMDYCREETFKRPSKEESSG